MTMRERKLNKETPKTARTLPSGARRAVLLSSLAVAFVTGCGVSVVGDWRCVKALPNRDVFAIEDASFHSDDTFAMRFTEDGRTRNEEGGYDFNGFKLVLRPRGGGRREFTAVRRIGTLEVSQGERRVYLEKK